MNPIFFPVRISAILIAVFVGLVLAQYQEYRARMGERYFLALQMTSSVDGQLVVYYNRGDGYLATDRSDPVHVNYRLSEQSVVIPLPAGSYLSFRLDPVESGTGKVSLTRVAIVNGNGDITTDLLREAEVSAANATIEYRSVEKVELVFNHSTDPQIQVIPSEVLNIEGEHSRFFGLGSIFALYVVPILSAVFTWLSAQFLLQLRSVQSGLGRLNSEPFWLRRIPWMLFSCVLLHRVVILLLHAEYLGEYIEQNVNALTYQYLTIENIVSHPWLGLLYLQQAPPIPQFLLSLVVANWGWGVESYMVMIGIQALISATTALLMYRVMCLFGSSRILFAILTLAFALSPDLVVMETNWFGQTVYENLCMVWLLLAVLQFYKYCAERKLSNSVMLGLWIGLLALTRASFSYLFFPVFVLMMLCKIKDGKLWQYALVFLMAWAPLQVGWAVKNQVIYGYFSISNSSWVGYNLFVGFHKVGLLDELLEKARHLDRPLPDAFDQLYGENSSLLMWSETWLRRDLVPDEVNAIDDRIIEKLGGNYRVNNTLGCKELGDICKDAYIRVIRKNPELLWEKVMLSWTDFWRPIREYAYLFVDPYYTCPVVPSVLDVGNVALQLTRYDADLTYRYDSEKPLGFSDAVLLSIPLLPRLLWVWNTFNFVLLLLCVPLWVVWKLLRKKPVSSVLLLLILILGIIFYLALVTTLVEAGREHCRYRIPVEPLLWVLGAVSLHHVLERTHRLLGRKGKGA